MRRRRARKLDSTHAAPILRSVSRLNVISAGVPGTAPDLVARAREIAPKYEILSSPSEELLEPRITEVEVAFSGLPAALVPRATALRWVQLGGAGVEGALARYPHPRVLLTNASGVHAVPITERVLGFLFAFARGLNRSLRAQVRHEWLAHPSHQLFERSTSGAGSSGTWWTERRATE